MSSKAELQARLTLNNSAFVRGMQSSMAFAQGLARRMAAIGTAGVVAGMAAAGAAVVAFSAALKKGLASAGQFNDLGNRIGDLSGNAAVLAKAFEFAGLSSDDMASAINRMQKAIAGGSDAFGKLGISVDELRAMSPTAQFVKIGDAIAGIQDPAQRTATAMEIFGKAGGKLNQVFGDSGGLALARKALGSMPEILNKSGGAMDDLGDCVDALKLKSEAFSVGFASGLTGLIPLIDRVIGFDAAALGQGIAKDLAEAFNGRTVTQAIIELGSKFVRGLTAAFQAGSQALVSILTNAFAGPIAELQARAAFFMDMGDADPLTADESARRTQLGIDIQKTERELRGMKPDGRAENVAGFLFGDLNSYEGKKHQLNVMRAEKARLDQRQAEYEQRTMSVEDRKAEILAGGVRTGFGEGQTSEEWMKGAQASISAAVGADFPKTFRPVSPAFQAPAFHPAAAAAVAGSAMPVPVPQMTVPATGEMTSIGGGESAPQGPGSQANAWNAFAAASRSTLGPQGLKLGAVRTAAETAATSRSIWRGRNQQEPSPSQIWKSPGSEAAAAKGGRKNESEELFKKACKNLETLRDDVHAMAH